LVHRESLNILGTSKVHGRGKIAIPIDVRRKLGIEDGDLVYFLEDEKGEIVLRKSQRTRFRIR